MRKLVILITAVMSLCVASAAFAYTESKSVPLGKDANDVVVALIVTSMKNDGWTYVKVRYDYFWEQYFVEFKREIKEIAIDIPWSKGMK